MTRLRTIDVGGVDLSVHDAGPADGPVVVLLHGFPEIAYSWRHQIPVLAEAGYRVLAPDQRGYGWSGHPPEVADYGIFELAGDVIGLLDTEGVEHCSLVGHDWGSILAAQVALFRPDRLRQLVLMSVPYQPRAEMSVVEFVRRFDPTGPFAYMVEFQDEGVLEAEMDRDPIEILRVAQWRNCGAMPADGEVPPGLPPHLSPGEFENYARAFARSGFRGPINWYRNMDANWAATRPWHGAPITVPTWFVAGENDFVVTPDRVATLDRTCTDFRGATIVEGAGHWVQQEAPDQVNAALLETLAAPC